MNQSKWLPQELNQHFGTCLSIDQEEHDRINRIQFNILVLKYTKPN
jgi:hypothetical protein